MDANTLENQLHAEGFRTTYVWQDGPDAHYPDHTHPTETAHIILSGEMTLTMNGAAKTYPAGSDAMCLRELRVQRRWGREGADT